MVKSVIIKSTFSGCVVSISQIFLFVNYKNYDWEKKMKTVKYTGILPAFITPFKEDNQTINTPAVRQMIDRLLEQGANGFYILGATGEGLVMSREAREEMCEVAVEHTAGRKPVICHVASMNLNETVELAKHAERTGVDAIASVPPFFYYYDGTDIYNYYKKIANSVHIPVIVYHHPSASKNMSAELLAKIFEIDNVMGVKWSTNDFYEMMRLKDLTQGEMNIINGPDEMLICGLAAGADAGIGSTYTSMLPEYVRLYNCVQEGKLEEARQIQYKINRVIGVFLKNECIPGVKYAAVLQGFDVGEATYPMRHFTEQQKKDMEAELRANGWPFTEQ